MLDVLLVSAKASIKIVLICAAGSYLQQAGIFTKDIRKGNSEAFVKLLLPCMLFTRILPMVSTETLPIMAWLALANVLYVTVGFTIGSLTVCMTKPAPHLRSILSLVPAIGHANSIPFLLLPLLCTEHDGFREQDSKTAQGYVGLYLVMHSITLWGVGLNVIKKEKDGEQSEPPPAATAAIGLASPQAPPPQILGSAAGVGSAAPAASGGDIGAGPAISRATADTSRHAAGRSMERAGVWGAVCAALARTFGLDLQDDRAVGSVHRPGAMEAGEARDEVWADSVPSLETGSMPSPADRRLLCKPDALSRLVPKWLNRPVMTALLASVLGLSPGVKSLFVAPSSSMHFVFDAMETLGDAGSVVALLGVGALFTADGVPKPSKIGYRPLAGVLFGRLVVLPMCCLPAWMVLRRVLPVFPDDRVFMLVVCIEACTPSAYNLVTMCILQGRNATDVAAALFYQNLLAIFTLTAWVTIILFYVI